MNGLKISPYSNDKNVYYSLLIHTEGKHGLCLSLDKSIYRMHLVLYSFLLKHNGTLSFWHVLQITKIYVASEMRHGSQRWPIDCYFSIIVQELVDSDDDVSGSTTKLFGTQCTFSNFQNICFYVLISLSLLQLFSPLSRPFVFN